MYYLLYISTIYYTYLSTIQTMERFLLKIGSEPSRPVAAQAGYSGGNKETQQIESMVQDT